MGKVRPVKAWVLPEFKEFMLQKRAENPNLKTNYDVQRSLMGEQIEIKKKRFNWGKL